ncbi:MAG: hypothetical protein CVV51_13270 [Spirochaetae bacterium HGW-Spirochaetae-7]|jgi:hypothetical protein|nr:MAG: hypothetical protein CVV51_13270 [Spirochaetae bacterium HGW-Spirochaetae-7]
MGTAVLPASGAGAAAGPGLSASVAAWVAGSENDFGAAAGGRRQEALAAADTTAMANANVATVEGFALALSDRRPDIML